MSFITDWINDGFNGIVEAIAITAGKLADAMLSSAFGQSGGGQAWRTVIGADTGTPSEGLAGGNTAGLMDSSQGGMLWDIIALMAPVTVALIAVQVLIGMFKRSKAAILRAFVGGLLAIPLCLASVFLIHTVDTAVGDFSKNIAKGGSTSYMQALGYTSNAVTKKTKTKTCTDLVKEAKTAAAEKKKSRGEASKNNPGGDQSGVNDAAASAVDDLYKTDAEKQKVTSDTKCNEWRIDWKRTDIWGKKSADGTTKTSGLLYGTLLSTLAALSGLVLKCVMFFRQLALLLLAAFAPIALMVIPFEGTKGWSVKWAELVVGFILAQPASAIVFALSMKLASLDGRDSTTAAMGIAGLLMSAVAPFLVMKFLSFSSVAATGDLHSGAGRAAGGVVRGGTSMVRAGRGAAGGVGAMTRSVTRMGRK